MTNTERNDRFFAQLKYRCRKTKDAPTYNDLFVKVQEVCSSDVILSSCLPISPERFLRELNKFITRAQRDGYARPIIKCAMRVRKQLSILSTRKDDSQPSRLQLIQKLKELERQVNKSISPSGHETISENTKHQLNHVSGNLRELLLCHDIGNILSPDRIRILKSDLVYIQKREHLFT